MRKITAGSGWGDWPLVFVVGVFSFLFHEAAHWLTGTMLGYDMVATPNRVWSKTATSVEHGILIVLAGPVFTLIQALAGFGLVTKSVSKLGFAMLYIAFFQRLLATAATLSKPNDESQVSLYLGIGKWTLPILVTMALWGLVSIAARKMRLGFRDLCFYFLTASLTVTIVIGVDKFFFANS